LRTAIGSSGANINFNPDRVEFTAGTGYAAPSNPVAATSRALGGGGLSLEVTEFALPALTHALNNATQTIYPTDAALTESPARDYLNPTSGTAGSGYIEFQQSGIYQVSFQDELVLTGSGNNRASARLQVFIEEADGSDDVPIINADHYFRQPDQTSTFLAGLTAVWRVSSSSGLTNVTARQRLKAEYILQGNSANNLTRAADMGVIRVTRVS